MRIFDKTRTKELQLSDINLEMGQLVSTALKTTDANGNESKEYILVYLPSVGKARAEIKALKAKLAETDYKAIKFAEGELSAYEYESVKAERRAWRERINELEDFIRTAETTTG